MTAQVQVLLIRSGGRLCALPVQHVAELCRPLPTEALGAVPDFVRGLTQLRGVAVPVLDLNRLLGGTRDTLATRYVSLRVGEQKVALAVEEVLELKRLDSSGWAEMPPLLAGAAPAVQAIASLDSGLLLVLQAARLIPEGDWQMRAGQSA